MYKTTGGLVGHSPLLRTSAMENTEYRLKAAYYAILCLKNPENQNMN